MANLYVTVIIKQCFMKELIQARDLRKDIKELTDSPL